MQRASSLVTNNPNASVAGLTGAIVTVAAVVSDDAFGYEPSSPAFWPAVATLVVAGVLAIGRRKEA